MPNIVTEQDFARHLIFEALSGTDALAYNSIFEEVVRRGFAGASVPIRHLPLAKAVFRTSNVRPLAIAALRPADTEAHLTCGVSRAVNNGADEILIQLPPALLGLANAAEAWVRQAVEFANLVPVTVAVVIDDTIYPQELFETCCGLSWGGAKAVRFIPRAPVLASALREMRIRHVPHLQLDAGDVTDAQTACGFLTEGGGRVWSSHPAGLLKEFHTMPMRVGGVPGRSL